MILEPDREIFAACAPGSLMRSAVVDDLGLTRFCRRDCELYSVQILSAGAWIRARILTGTGRPIWFQPSTYTGSFVLMAGAEEGLILEQGGRERGGTLMLNWREPDTRII